MSGVAARDRSVSGGWPGPVLGPGWFVTIWFVTIWFVTVRFITVRFVTGLIPEALADVAAGGRGSRFSQQLLELGEQPAQLHPNGGVGAPHLLCDFARGQTL